MAIQIDDRGARNVVVIDPEVMSSGTGWIGLSGDDNEVRIGAGCSAHECFIRLGDRCKLIVGNRVSMAKLEVYAVERASVEIGSETSFTYHTRLYLHEPGRIKIGQQCLIADGTFFTVSDMHSLIDLDSGLRINHAQNVTIGNNVWLAAQVTLLKGVQIGDGSVIGFRSTVTHDIPAGCLAAGSPARVIRERTTWRADLIPESTADDRK